MPNTRNAGRKPRITKEQLVEIKARRDAGESVASLAQEYGVSRQALNKRLVEDREQHEVQLDYYVQNELCTSIFVDRKSQTLRLINYALGLSKRAFGLNDNPDWGEFRSFLEDLYLRERGIEAYNQLLCIDRPEKIDNFKETTEGATEKILLSQGQWIPIFEFSKTDKIINRTDTDGFQLKALSKDRKYFFKSQAVMSGVHLRDWAVEIIASDICRQLKISCVKQHHCQFVYEGRALDGVYSDNFELDGYTFISFERLLERNGKSSKDEEFISLGAIDKLKWCARELAHIGQLKYEDTLKYMLNLAIVDCLVGNVDRHTKNFGLFFNAMTGKYEIPLIFDNGMGLFEHDYYRDNYHSFEEAMNSVYVSPYGEDPFDMIRMLDEEFCILDLYPGLKDLKYPDILSTPFAQEYERRMLELWQK